jgi:hypothetical protein
MVKPKLVALMPHPIALALTPDGLAVVDYGGAPGERGKGRAAPDSGSRQRCSGRYRLAGAGQAEPVARFRP